MCDSSEMDDCGQCYAAECSAQSENFCPPDCTQCQDGNSLDMMCCDAKPADCYDPCEPPDMNNGFSMNYNNMEGPSCETYSQPAGCCPPSSCPPDCCPPSCPPSCCPPSCPSTYPPTCCAPAPDPDSNEHKPNCCPCPGKCQMPSCSPFAVRKYIAPPRTPSCKPVVNYQKPTVPFSSDTIYRRSYEGFEPKVCCRTQLIRPKGFLGSANVPFESETVTKLSFQPFCGLERTKPAFPADHQLLGTGPMQGLTTQKHDYVAKFQYRRKKCAPRDTIHPYGCMESATTNRLSYMEPCVDGRRASFRPNNKYKRPEIPMDCSTTQQLSYMPVMPSKREEFPWAKKPKYLRPTVGFATDTVTKLSFQPPGCFVDEIPSQPCCS